MEKLVIPKHEGNIDIIIKAMKVYYDRKDINDGWVNNTTLKAELGYKEGDKNSSDYTKKGQVAAYFGFIEFDNENSSNRRITESGINFYEAYAINNDSNEYEKILIESIKNTTFGRNNHGSEDSNSDVEPPNVFIRAILDLGNISNSEFGYILYLLHNEKKEYEQAIKEIIKIRNTNINIPNLNQIKKNDKCYFDAKPIASLRQLGLFERIDTTKTKNRSKLDTSHRFIIRNDFRIKYIEVLSNLGIYNQEIKNILSNVDIYSVEENIDDIESILDERIYGLPILSGDEKDKQNNRKPKRSSHKKGRRYYTNPSIKKTAIDECGYKCFYDENHTLFKNKYNENYVEGHHIVPMKAQDDFKKINLDRTENIVPLCPYCHKAIHHGSDDIVKEKLQNIFDKRKDLLENIGIKIELEALLKKYY